MSTQVVQDIWQPECGIQDLPPDRSNLTVPALEIIRREWKGQKELLEEVDQLRTFSDQLSREWAIETGIIENLYDIERGVTQTLIEQGFQSALIEHGSINKDRDYVINLLNDQQAALEGLFAFVKQERPLTVSYIKELHAMMTASQLTTEAFTAEGNVVEIELVRGDWKKNNNFPFRNGIQYRYCPPEQTASEMDRLIELHVAHVASGIPPEVEAAWLHHRFTQIHPFQDGNGRVARALASLVLIQAGLFPLVVPRDDKTIYLESLERADAGNLRSLILLISRRQESAYQKALNLMRKHAPAGETLDEAAAMLGAVYSSRQDILNERQEKRVDEFLARLLTELEKQSQRATSQILSSAGITNSIGGGFSQQQSASLGINLHPVSLQESSFEIVRSVVLEHWQIVISRPAKEIRIIIRVKENHQFLVSVHTTNPDYNTSVQAIGLSFQAGGLQPVDVPPIVWKERDDIGTFISSLQQWVESLLIRVLLIVRTSM